MKRLDLLVLILLLSFILVGCGAKNDELIQADAGSDEAEIKQLVQEFGSRLQEVSLLAPKDTVSQSIWKSYAEYVSPALLEKWQSNPENAPGRVASSPWPDRIDIQTVEKLTENEYKVQGEVIEVTSVEKEKGGYAAKRPIDLSIRKIDDRWLIDDLTMGSYQATDTIEYENVQYGFSFSLPASWKDFSIVSEKWEGLASGGSQGQAVVETGPLVSLRHPLWTAESPRQDIPIMIFTINQWNDLQKGNYHIGAAPVGPNELGRNAEYVFALPARYNFAFPTGFEEVEEILRNNPLQEIESKK